MLEQCLVSKGAMPNVEGGICDHHVNLALELGVLAKIVVVLAKGSILKLGRILDNLYSV